MPHAFACTRHVLFNTQPAAGLQPASGQRRGAQPKSLRPFDGREMAEATHRRLSQRHIASVASDLHHVHCAAGHRRLSTHGARDGTADADAFHHALARAARDRDTAADDGAGAHASACARSAFRDSLKRERIVRLEQIKKIRVLRAQIGTRNGFKQRLVRGRNLF